jgi:drug/metabolite transporter (DMT)-like permease
VFCLAAFLVTPRSQPLGRVLEFGVLWKLLGIGVSATIGQVFLTLAFGRGAPAKVSVVGLMQIVFVMALSVWLFNRGVNTLAVLGTVLVIAPTAWVLVQPKATSELPQKPAAGGEPGPPLRREVARRADAEAASPPFPTPQLRP